MKNFTKHDKKKEKKIPVFIFQSFAKMTKNPYFESFCKKKKVFSLVSVVL